jgi:seryl-tRNA synthetase
MSEQLNGKQCAADRANDGVDRIPGGVDPRDFVGNKFQEIENASDRDDHGIAEDFERLIRGRESNPVEMNGQAGGENGEVKIDPGEAGQPERHTEKMQFFHIEIIGARDSLSRPDCRFALKTAASTICLMLDIRLIREQPDFVKSRLATRGGSDEARINELIEIDVARRKAETALQQLNAERKQLSKTIGQKKAQGKSCDDLEDSVRVINDDIAMRELTLRDVLEKDQRDLLLQIPNLPHANAPVGKDASANPVVRSWGEKPKLGSKFLDHVALGTKLKLFDLERAAKLSGSGFVCFTGVGAKLERALINFMLDLHTREHGYLEISPPFLVRRDCMIGTTQLPKFEEDMYGLEPDTNGRNTLFLAPTAEVPVTNLHREEILGLADLPKKFVAYTPCFRREAGSAGRETRGIIRVHQFDKVELVKITTPESSYDEHEKLTADAERILQLLGLHYRVIELCTGDLGFGSAKMYDIEVWSPGQNAYLEVSSCSNFEDFQARRMNLRFKDGEGKNRFCHTLNGSGLALPRLFAALIESGQQEDGSIRLPEILLPYFGEAKIESAN